MTLSSGSSQMIKLKVLLLRRQLVNPKQMMDQIISNQREMQLKLLNLPLLTNKQELTWIVETIWKKKEVELRQKLDLDQV